MIATMSLFYSPASPFARKVLMVAHETGQSEAIAVIKADAWGSPPELLAQNPLSKVPALILADGSALYDSPVIAEYLDSLHSGTPMFPPSGPARWTALRLQALADGICDAAILRIVEGRREEAQRSPAWIERQKQAVNRALDVLEQEADTLASETMTIGTLAIFAALGYLDFRLAAEDWRIGRPRLSAWFNRAADRDSFRRTVPE